MQHVKLRHRADAPEVIRARVGRVGQEQRQRNWSVLYFGFHILIDDWFGALHRKGDHRFSRKNKLPAGDVMVTLFVPLVAVMA